MDAGLTTADFNKQLVRTLYEECINSRDLDRLDSLVAPDFQGPRGEYGPREFRATIQAVLTGFPDLRFELHDLFAEGDRVALRWSFRARHGGWFAGQAASRRQVTQEGHAIYQVRDGLLVRAWLQADRLGVLQQIGALPPSFVDGRVGRPL